MLKNTLSQYGVVAKFFHWLIFFLVFFMIFLGFLLGLEVVKNKELSTELLNIHKLTGLSILILMILRAIWASINPKPLLPPGTPSWQRYAERIVHFSLYGSLIIMPLAGWVSAVAAGHPPKLFGWEITLPIPKSESLSDTAFSVHVTFAIIIIVLVSIHVAAAFYHYFIKKDDILQRMLPD